MAEIADQMQLRDISRDDIPLFFEHQLDLDARYMAAFTVRDPTDRAAFAERWARIVADDTICKQTIIYRGHVAGHVLHFEHLGRREVSYWIRKEDWGHGVATQALHMFLQHTPTRPLYARAATDNAASIRVLQKCGFAMIGEDSGFALARGTEVTEYLFVKP